MSAEHCVEHVENLHFVKRPNDGEPLRESTAMATTVAPDAAADRTTNGSSGGGDTNTDTATPTQTNEVAFIGEAAAAAAVTAAADGDGSGSSSSNSNSNNCDNRQQRAERVGPLMNAGGPGVDGDRRRTSQDRNGNATRRRTRRGKSKRGKSSTSRPYSRTQWKYQGAAASRRSGYRRRDALAAIRLKAPMLQSDQPPLVPYNTNRFLMEDHMPNVLTPSEDEEEFLTKEFSSVYEDALCEQLDGLSKAQLIKDFLQLEAKYEKLSIKYESLLGRVSGGIEEDSGATGQGEGIVAAATVAITTSAPINTSTKEQRLEDRVRELTIENMDLRRQLEHVTRLGMVLSAQQSMGDGVVQPFTGAHTGASSEDSESDSSSSSSSSSSSDSDSSSSMSDDLVDVPMEDDTVAVAASPVYLNGTGYVNGDGMDTAMANGGHPDDDEDDAGGSDLANGDDGSNSLHSPQPPPSSRPPLAIN